VSEAAVPDVSGKRCVVMGLGLFSGGVEAVRWLAARGARILVTDLRDAEVLAPSMEALRDLDVEWRMGEHREDDFRSAEVVVVNPGVPVGHPLLSLAAEAGAVLETETNLFLRTCPAQVVAVTGSNGKSTTASLLAAMLDAAGKTVHLGGNIGRSLLNVAPEMDPGDVAVLEISSFQLEWTLRAGLRPHHAVLTNVMLNHLDRHGSFEAYLRAKAGVTPGSGGVLVVGDDDDGARRVAEDAACRVVRTSLRSDPGGDACWWAGDRLMDRRSNGENVTVMQASDIRLRGSFNRANVACAAAMARELGATTESVAEGCRGFPGLPHRLEDCGEVGGVRCVNDSKATTPDAAALALGAFEENLVVIAGGSDKGADLAPFGRTLAARARAVVLIGHTAPELREAIQRAETGTPDLHDADSMEAAVGTGLEAAAAGDVLLLSPGHASFGMFRNYEERGDRFREAVRRRAASA
jgi:UDP-N-acetylmuramoylalanine--D-glutamate ligase